MILTDDGRRLDRNPVSDDRACQQISAVVSIVPEHNERVVVGGTVQDVTRTSSLDIPKTSTSGSTAHLRTARENLRETNKE